MGSFGQTGNKDDLENTQEEQDSESELTDEQAALIEARMNGIRLVKKTGAGNQVHYEIPAGERLDFAASAPEMAEADNTDDQETTCAPAEGLKPEPIVALKKPEPAKGNKHFVSDYVPERVGFANVGGPQELVEKLAKVKYECLPHLAIQISLLLNTPTDKIRALLLEGPSGCGKSYMAKSLAKISGAELMCLSCYKNMPLQNLIESPSTFAMASAMAGKGEVDAEKLMNLGILSRAFQASQERPVILLIDELDKPDSAIDTFFLGPIQDSRIWLESRDPIDANPDNLLIMFTKNFNRKLDEALLRRCHPITMTYLDSTLERKILSPHCDPQLVANLVSVADRMRNSAGSYAFERPPAPEELLTAGHYVTRLLQWGFNDFAYIGKSVWPIIAKSEHDRAVMDHMMRYHPDFLDPLIPDSKNATVTEIHARLGRVILHNIIADPDAQRREEAWKEFNGD